MNPWYMGILKRATEAQKMGRLNGPYSYSGRGPYLVRDKDGNLVAKCASAHYAQQVAASLTDAWKREKAAIDAVEYAGDHEAPRGGD